MECEEYGRTVYFYVLLLQPIGPQSGIATLSAGFKSDIDPRLPRRPRLLYNTSHVSIHDLL